MPAPRPLRTERRGLASLTFLFVLLSLPRSGSAHQSSVVYSEVAVRGRTVEYTFQVANTDLYEALGLDRDRPLSRREAETGKGRIAAYLAARVTVSNQGVSCPPLPGATDFIDKTDGFFLIQRVEYRCPRSIENALITYNLFFDLDPRHQGLAHIDAFGSQTEHVFRDRSRSLPLSHPLTVWDNARDYLELGIEHIFTGYDHLSFLLCLLIIAGRFSRRQYSARAGVRYVVGVVSAFTLAHSVTLILSALEVLKLPDRVTEPAIAASIAYVALENMLKEEPRHRFLLTFCFGLIHGFGFSSVLREIGLPRKGLLLSLLSFNLGIETGQLVVVALVFPVLFLLATRTRTGFYGRWVQARGSALVFLLALLWFVERVSGRTLFRGLLG